jgi:DNA-binding CsgD family transcriptional regulator
MQVDGRNAVLNALEAGVQPAMGALQDGRWEEARLAFEAVLAEQELPEAHVGLAEALWWLGDRAAMMEHYEQAYAGFRRRPDPASAAGIALLLSLYLIRYEANRSQAEGWFRRGARLIEDHAVDGLRGELALFEGCLQHDAVEMEACARRAADHARGTGALDLELCALSLLGHALIEQGRIEEGMPLLDEAMAASLGGEPERLDTVVFTSCNMMVSCARCAAFERAAEWVRAVSRFAERYGCPFLFAECRLVYGSVLYQTGRWEEAERELRAAMDLGRDAVPTYFAEAAAALAQLRIAQGRIEEAERLVDGIEFFDAGIPVVARLHLVHGRYDLAGAVAEARITAEDDLRLDCVLLVELIGESEIAQGDRASAARRGRRLVELGTLRGCRIAVARGERLTGRALAASEPEASRRHLDRARLEFKRLEMPFEAALAGLALAESLAKTNPDLAIAEAQTALAEFDTLGAERCADEAAALLRSLGVRVGRAGPRTDGDITPREEEVLALLGEGLSNPEIAERLYISRKTVEHHVSNLLAKLDLRNRSEAAAEAVRRGLVGISAD